MLFRSGDLYKGSLTHQVIRVVPLDGSEPIIRRVRGIDPAFDDLGGGSQVRVTEAWPRSLRRVEIAMIEWLFQGRFASDTLVVSYVTHCHSTITLSVTTLPVAPAENL